MPDKLTDLEIVKALECCSKPVSENCKECPLCSTDCMEVDIEKLALDLINRLQAENERLDRTVKEYAYLYDKHMNTPFNHIKAEAYKEFAERLKEESYERIDLTAYVEVSDINNLLKELVGEDNE